jgi:hypothetical protein
MDVFNEGEQASFVGTSHVYVDLQREADPW